MPPYPFLTDRAHEASYTVKPALLTVIPGYTSLYHFVLVIDLADGQMRGNTKVREKRVQGGCGVVPLEPSI